MKNNTVRIEFASAEDLYVFTKLAAMTHTTEGTPGNLIVGVACAALKRAKIHPEPGGNPLRKPLAAVLGELQDAHDVHVWPVGDEGSHAIGKRAATCQICKVFKLAQSALVNGGAA